MDLNLAFGIFYGSLIAIVSFLIYKFWREQWMQKKAAKDLLKQAKDYQKKKNEADASNQPSRPSKKSTQKILEMLRQAESLIAREKHVAAKKLLIKILAEEENNADASAHLGYIYLNEAKYKRAEGLLRQALVERPRDPQLLTNFALVVFQQKQPKRINESIEALRLATEIDSRNAEHFANLGQVFFFAGEIKPAIEAFITAVRLQPRNLEYLFFYADALLASQEYTAAKKVFAKILEIAPMNQAAKKELDGLIKEGY